jgi:hypothetical protein
MTGEQSRGKFQASTPGKWRRPMTPEQLRVRLNLMTGDQRQAFLRSCNLDPTLKDDQIVWKFQQPGAWNERMRHALGDWTDGDTTSAASVEAASYARRGYYVAVIVIVIAVVGAIFALVK